MAYCCQRNNVAANDILEVNERQRKKFYLMCRNAPLF